MTADTLADTSTAAATLHAYPDGWRVVRLGEVCHAGSRSINPQDYPGEEFEYYSIPAFQDSGVPARELGKLILSNKLLVERRTVLFGKLNPRVLKVWMVSDSGMLRAIASTEFLPVLANARAVPEYLYFVCQSRHVVQEAKRLVNGSTPSRQRVDPTSFYDINIPLPPLAEQRAIARVLRAAQEAIAARRREVGLERERKAALMQRLFTRGTRGEATKRTEIGEAPESWQVVRLGEIARIERGKFSHRPRNDPEFYGGHVPFIQTGDVTASDGRITSYTQTLNEKGLAVSRVFPKGTIVITIAANIGYTGILELDSAFPDSLIGITPGADVDVRYLHYYLVTQQPEMDWQAPQGTQKNINIEFLSPWLVRLPPIAEQREIAAILAACDAQIAALEREIVLHDELFRALLEELMSGRVSALGLVGEAEGMSGHDGVA